MPRCNELKFTQMALRIAKIIARASYGVPGLPYAGYTARPIDVFQMDSGLAGAMRTRPTNTVGAAFRCSYWLAVASLSIESGVNKIQLLKYAYGFFIMACNAAAIDATYYTPSGFIARTMANHTGAMVRSAEKEEINKVLTRGIEVAASNGNEFVAINNISYLIQLPDCEDRDNIDLGLPTGNVGIGAFLAFIAVVAIGGAAIASRKK